MNRYMIYMPAGTQGRLVPCHLNGSLTLVVGEDAKLFDAKRNDKATWLYLHQDCDKIVGDAFLCAAVDGALIGFTKPVAKTICEEFGIDMEDDAWKD